MVWVLVLLFVLCQPVGALSFGLHANDAPPWVYSEEYEPSGFLSSIEHPTLTGDRFLLVAPLWREDDRYRVILGVYGARELVLPPGSVVYQVLVPSRVEWKRTDVPKQVFPEGPWSPVRFQLKVSDGLLQLKPSRTMGGVFVVEAGLPTRDGWIRIALTPGHWLVALGWTLDFNLLTMDGRVLFRGRAPYDKVEYDLPNGVHLAFWCGFYALDLREHGTLSPDDVPGDVGLALPVRFDPWWQYGHKLFYGHCIVLEVRTENPLIIEFPAPRPGTQIIKAGVIFQLVTDDYIRQHTHTLLWNILPNVPLPPLPLARRRRHHRPSRS